MTALWRRPRHVATIALAIVAGASGSRARADDPGPTFLSEVEAARVAIDHAEFVRARDAITALRAAHPKPDAAVAALLLDLVARLSASRTSWFADRAPARLVAELSLALRARAGAGGATFADVQAWARKEVVETAFAAMTAWFRAKDSAVTPEETRGFFGARPRTERSWRVRSYGAASFLVDPGTATPAERNAWFEKATPIERADFWLLRTIELSGLFDVAPKRDRSNCALCNGEGLISRTLANATQLTYLCPRCGGSRFDLTVKYR